MVIKVVEVEVEVQCNLLDMSISEEPVYQITRYDITEDHKLVLSCSMNLTSHM